MSNIIQPRILKGFRDFLPEAEIERALLIEKLTQVFRENGFVPIDTPALEYAEILLRKSDGETEKQIYRFLDNGERDVALRFDLTVPLARFVAEHIHEIHIPFKRYHIGKVWRGEKPQAGRYREFVQCDFDSVGLDSATCDFEIIKLIIKSMNALNAPSTIVHFSHRGLFNRLFNNLNIQNHAEDILRIIDKITKIGKDAVAEELNKIISEKHVAIILSFISCGENNEKKQDFEQIIDHMQSFLGGYGPEIKRLTEVYTLLKAVELEKRCIFNPSITRGLDYYTGIVFETFLSDLPSIGSVCSGGRYDNLTGMYSKQKLSGVGASIGLDRLLAAFAELNQTNQQTSFIKAIIFFTKKNTAIDLYRLAEYIATKGIAVEVYPEYTKMVKQYQYAEQKHIEYGIFLDTLATPIEATKINIRQLTTRAEFQEVLPSAIKKLQ